VLRKYALFIGVAALGALVTSCGSDDTGTPTPTPTDTSTATPTPTPTPTTVTFDLSQDFATESTNANYAFAYFTADSGGDETFSGASRLNGLATINFAISPELVSFDFVDLDDPVTFNDTELVSASATLRSYERGTEKLLMELPYAHVLRVSYESQADFTRDTTDGTLRGQRVSIFFNTVTTADAIAADITYNGSVQVVGGDPATTLSGVISAPDTSFLVDESENTISGTIQVFEDVNGTPTLVATIPFEATLNSNGTFSGALEDTTNNLEGGFAGALSGPNREELFILFSVSGNVDADDDRRYVGSFIGDQ
jgi:hypothetical protein